MFKLRLKSKIIGAFSIVILLFLIASGFNVAGVNRTVVISLTIISTLFGVIFSIYLTNHIIDYIVFIKDLVNQLQSVCTTNLGNGLKGMVEGDLDIKVEKITKPMNLNQNDALG